MNVRQMRKLEQELFSEFKHDRIVPVRVGEVRFSPSYHLESGLINQDLIDGLLRGARLLSVGAGKGYLERLLAHVGVPENNMVLVDRAPVVPSEFPSYQFDMYGEWPSMGSFDYVLFPRSVFLRVRSSVDDTGMGSANEALDHLLVQSHSRLVHHGQMRMTGYLPDETTLKEVKTRFISEHPGVAIRYFSRQQLSSANTHADFLQLEKS